MIEKIKYWLISTAAPILGLLGIVFLLFQKNEDLKEQIKDKDADKAIAQTETKLEGEKADADQKSQTVDSEHADFKQHLAEYQSRTGKLPD